MTIFPEIPYDQRTSLLKPLLTEYLDVVERLENHEDRHKLVYGTSFFALTFPSLVWSESVPENPNELKTFMDEVSIPSQRWHKELEKIVNEDLHLRKCCSDAVMLARALDLFQEFMRNTQNTTEQNVDSFIDMLYSEPFEAAVYSHIYNLFSQLEILDFDEMTIEEVKPHRIPVITGEYTARSALYSGDAGRHFVIYRTDEIVDSDFHFVVQAHENAKELIRLFQYYKDGVVHINFSVAYYRPVWVNALRKFGINYWGDLRRYSYADVSRYFRISSEECCQLQKRWTMFTRPEIREKFGSDRSKFGKVIETAGVYYELSLTHEALERRLVDLSIAFEALFSPSDKAELSHQMSQFAALFVGKSPSESKEIYAFLKDMYGKRSKLVHGSASASDQGFLEIEEIERFGGIIREAIVGFIALYLNESYDNRDNLHKALRNGMFDHDLANEIRVDADIELLIEKMI